MLATFKSKLQSVMVSQTFIQVYQVQVVDYQMGCFFFI